MLSFADQPSSSSLTDQEPAMSAGSLKQKQHSLFPCFKNYLKRKFSGSGDKAGEECDLVSFSSPNHPFGLTEAMSHQTTPSTIATAGVIAAALCDSPEPADGEQQDPNSTFLKSISSTTTSTTTLTSSQPQQPVTQKWTPKKLIQDPPPPDQSPNLSSFFESFIRANLVPERLNGKDPISTSSFSATAPPEKPCQVSGLVNKIITTVFTPESKQESVAKNETVSTRISRSSSNSAICQLLATPSLDQSSNFNASTSTGSNSNSSNNHHLSSAHIPDKVYHQLIEFEFNYEPIVRKFALASDDFSPSRNALNSLEAARITELTTVLAPLNVCLSSQSPEVSTARVNLLHSISGSTEVTVEFQRQALLTITQHSFNLLIALAKKLESFASLSSLDQKTLLRNSVMEIMLLRSIMVRPLTQETSSLDKTESTSVSADNYCTSHASISDETISDGDGDDSQRESDDISIRGILESDEEQQMAMMYAKQFRDGYQKLASTIDSEWKADQTIFYLVSTMITCFGWVLTSTFFLYDSSLPFCCFVRQPVTLSQKKFVRSSWLTSTCSKDISSKSLTHTALLDHILFEFLTASRSCTIWITRLYRSYYS